MCNKRSFIESYGQKCTRAIYILNSTITMTSILSSAPTKRFRARHKNTCKIYCTLKDFLPFLCHNVCFNSATYSRRSDGRGILLGINLWPDLALPY